MSRLYSPEQLYEEVAFVAYHFHWSHGTVLSMPHWERRQWCEQISAINEQRNADDHGGGGGGIEIRNPSP